MKTLEKVILILVVFVLTKSAFAGTMYIGTSTSLQYGPSRYATFGGDQTLTTDDVTGYITNGVLASAQVLYYGSSRSINFSAYTTSFAGGYVISGRVATTGQTAYYRSGLTAAVSSGTDIAFSSGYLTAATLSTTQTLYYASSRSVSCSVGTDVQFGGSGYLTSALLATAQDVYYGPSRIVRFRANPEVSEFDGSDYATHGRLSLTQNLQTSSGSVSVSGGTYVDFSGVYYTP